MENKKRFVVGILTVVVVLVAGVGIINSKLNSLNWRIVDPTLRTDVQIIFLDARPELQKEAVLLYQLHNRWNYSSVQFKDVRLDGDLDEVFCLLNQDIRTELVFDPNSEYSEGESWKTWQERFAEIHEEAVTGLKSGAEEFLQTKKEE